MGVVYHAKLTATAWCLECHRHPENFLARTTRSVNLDWKPDDVKPGGVPWPNTETEKTD